MKQARPTNFWSTRPRGVADSDFTVPCPYCGEKPRKGEKVTKVGASPHARWWHLRCLTKQQYTLAEQRRNGWRSPPEQHRGGVGSRARK